MENSKTKQKVDRREIRSVCVPVPTIVLNTSAAKNHEQASLSHSRSAGDLDMVLGEADDFQTTAKADGACKFSSSMSGGIEDTDHRNAVGLYCSPRMIRRSANSQLDCAHKRHSGMFIESLNACSLNCLDPGSRVGSTVSLNSEYTARSVGLISNDSNSECSQTCQSGVMDSASHKHVLKRFYSTPEKDEELLTYQIYVRRNSKSMGNMQKEDLHNMASFDLGSDSTDDNIPSIDQSQNNANAESCDIDNSLAWRTSASAGDSEDGGKDTDDRQKLVKSVTGSVAMRDGRIRKWLTEIRDPEETLST